VLTLSRRETASAGNLAAHVCAMHDAVSRALHLTAAHGLTGHLTIRAYLSRALGRVVTIEMAIVAAKHPAARGVRALQPAARAARLRAGIHVPALRCAVVSTDGAAAIHVVTRLVAAVAIAAQKALIALRAFAVVTRGTAVAGSAARQTK